MGKSFRVFIDGSQGTTGLCIHDRLADFDEIELMRLSEADRKDPKARKDMINNSDLSFFCLPDDAARESMSFVENPKTKIIDTSTAHRVSPEFAYGFPELSKERKQAIAASKQCCVPGCHATGFIALAYPLMKSGLIDSSYLLSCFSVTGYSGGGKAMIAEYEDPGRTEAYDAPRFYSLAQKHKHLKEMQKVCSLAEPPIFSPIVSDFYRGMVVTIPLFIKTLLKDVNSSQLRMMYEKYYEGSPLITVEPFGYDGYFSANELKGTDKMQILITGNDEALTLMARFDNLGKGASGAAIQCMNLMLGIEETKGLIF